jgi:hypothetical protein
MEIYMSNKFNGILELIIFSDNFKQYSRAFKDLELTFQPYEGMTLNIVTSEYKIAKISWDIETNTFRATSTVIDEEIDRPNEELRMAEYHKFSNIQKPEPITPEFLEHYFPYDAAIEQPQENNTQDSFYLLNAIYRNISTIKQTSLINISNFLSGTIIGGLVVYLLT